MQEVIGYGPGLATIQCLQMEEILVKEVGDPPLAALLASALVMLMGAGLPGEHGMAVPKHAEQDITAGIAPAPIRHQSLGETPALGDHTCTLTVTTLTLLPAEVSPQFDFRHSSFLSSFHS